MANLDAPRGFQPVKHLNGNPWNGEFNIYYVPATDSTAIFMGDAVTHQGSADPTAKYPVVAQAAAAGLICGVVIGFGDNPKIMANVSDLSLRYRLASTAKYLAVVDDPDVIFKIQEDSTGNNLDADMVGLATDIAVGTGDTATGLSAMELDSSDTATALGQCRIVRLDPAENNALGANADWLVTINEHFYRQTADI